MQTHGTENPPFLGPRIGVDKNRTLNVNAIVFGALAGVNTHPDLKPFRLAEERLPADKKWHLERNCEETR